MSDPRLVRFYLYPDLKRRAEAGQHNFINRFCGVLRDQGFEIRFHDDSLGEQILSRSRSGHAVFLMTQPTTPQGLTIRLNYFYPFWNIERSAARWEWPVAQARFDPQQVPQKEARQFARYWRKRLFKGAADQTGRDGVVYVPLQGRLRSHRSFQFCSPLQMLTHLAAQDQRRDIVATLHPKETYSAQDLTELHALADRHPHLRIAQADMVQMLQRCDYVVTQNSAVALSGFFFGKPAVLFGRINFHHIAANVHDLGPQQALSQGPMLTPDYDAYLWWFLQHMSINAGKAEAETKILKAIRRAGWVP